MNLTYDVLFTDGRVHHIDCDYLYVHPHAYGFYQDDPLRTVGRALRLLASGSIEDIVLAADRTPVPVTTEHRAVEDGDPGII